MARPFATVLLLLSVSPAAGQSAGVDGLAWLQGCWIQEDSERTIEEHWMAPRGDAMVGVSRTSRNGRLRAYELVVIRSDSSGITYTAHPSGQPGAAFRSTPVGDGAVAFENPEHDFPRRIVYERAGPDSLVAWIEGPIGGEPRRITFRYGRTPCPGPG
jgi:hypothetical protein